MGKEEGSIMGMLKKGIDRIFRRQAISAAYYGLLKNQSDRRKVKKSKANNVLVADRKIFAYKRGFVIKDENYHKIFVIKRQAISGLNATMKIYDLEKNAFASVTRKPSFFSGRAEYDLYIKEEYFGTIYQKDRVNPKMSFPLLGWTIEGNFARGGFKAYDRNNVTTVRIRTANLGYDTYVIEYDDEDDELFALFILMTVELAYHK